MVTRVFVLFLTTILTARLGEAAAAAKPPADGPHVTWERSFSGALKKAKAAQKPVMIDFWAEWCGWCHELDRTTYRAPKVVALAEKFVSVKVDTEGSQAEARIASDYRVESLPTIAFVSPEGRLILRVNGFQRADEFTETLERALKLGGEVLSWEAALAADPRDAAALNKLGAHLFDGELYEDSRELLRRAIVVDAERPSKERKRSRTLLGIIMHFDNKPAEAEKVLKEALELKPADADEDAATWYTLGKSYLKTGKTAEGRRALQTVVESYPQSKPATRAKETLESLASAPAKP
jgi:thioredoxin-like negative regulator of GroEL